MIQSVLDQWKLVCINFGNEFRYWKSVHNRYFIPYSEDLFFRAIGACQGLVDGEITPQSSKFSVYFSISLFKSYRIWLLPPRLPSFNSVAQTGNSFWIWFFQYIREGKQQRFFSLISNFFSLPNRNFDHLSQLSKHWSPLTITGIPLILPKDVLLPN